MSPLRIVTWQRRDGEWVADLIRYHRGPRPIVLHGHRIVRRAMGRTQSEAVRLVRRWPK